MGGGGGGGGGGAEGGGGGRGAPGDAGNLRRGERDDLVRRVIAEDDVEIMEVAPGRAEDHHAPALRRGSHGRKLAVRWVMPTYA